MDTFLYICGGVVAYGLGFWWGNRVGSRGFVHAVKRAYHQGHVEGQRSILFKIKKQN